MTKIAVIKTGGKQYKVKEGQTLKVEKLDKKDGAKVKFETLMIATADAKEVNLGKPSLGKKVEGKVVEQIDIESKGVSILYEMVRGRDATE